LRLPIGGGFTVRSALEGDFAFALLTEAKGLFLCVDHTAANESFIFVTATVFSFASGLDSLLTLDGVPGNPISPKSLVAPPPATIFGQMRLFTEIILTLPGVTG